MTKVGYVFIICNFFKIELGFDHEVIKANLIEEVTGKEVFTSHVTGRSLLDEGSFPVIVRNSEK